MSREKEREGGGGLLVPLALAQCLGPNGILTTGGERPPTSFFEMVGNFVLLILIFEVSSWKLRKFKVG